MFKDCCSRINNCEDIKVFTWLKTKPIYLGNYEITFCPFCGTKLEVKGK